MSPTFGCWNVSRADAVRFLHLSSLTLSVVAQDRAQFSEWTDGLNLLRSDSARIATQETKDLIDQLTDIGIKVKMLDLSGEKVSIPTQLIPPPPPSNVDFFFE